MAAAGPIAPEPRPTSARELQAILRAEREGKPFFVYREPSGEQQIVQLDPQRSELTVGRNRGADVSLGWDEQVSGLHAVVELLAGELTLVDDGLSRNGSYVSGECVRGRRRLRDRDVLRFGRTAVLVRDPQDAERSPTVATPHPPIRAHLSAQQRRVLVVLCRPLRTGNPMAIPSTDQEIADELHLSVAAVKLHLRTLFDKFGVADLPQNKKRVALAARVLHSGLITDRDRT